MVFLHGTMISEENGVDLPIGNAGRKLRAWRAQGAEIVYLTHRRRPDEVENEKLVLSNHAEGPSSFAEFFFR